MAKFRYIYIEITNSCNFSCPFCPSSSLNQSEFMKLDDFKVVIDKIKKYTKTVYFHVKGEPLLHPYLKEMIDVCFNNNIDVCLTTNGVLINKYEDVILKYSNIKKINISLQSLINYKNQSDIDQYLNNLLLFLLKKKEKNPKLGINLRIWNDKINNNKLNLSVENYLRDNNILSIPNVRVSYADEFEWPNMNNEPIYQKGKCLGGITHLGVLVNGDIILCCLDHLGHTKLGNIFIENLEEVLESKKYVDIKKGWNNNISVDPLCQRCSYKNELMINKEVNS